jgi:hypothetical protein
MNRGFAWLPSAFRLSAALGGGKAPGCWWRDVVRKTTGLAAVRRGGAWVEEIRAVHPRLFEGPLLGYALTALTGLAGSTQEAQPETTRPEKARLARWESPPKPIRNKAAVRAKIVPRSPGEASTYPAATKRKALIATPAVNPTKTLPKLQAQADRSLLNRLVGGDAAVESAASGQPQLFAAIGKSSEALFPSVNRNSSAQRDWLSRLARRAGRALNQEQFEPAETAKSAWDDAQASRQAPSLMEQWTMPLDGTRASLDTLNRLTQEDLPGGEESSETAQRRFSRGQPPSLEKPLSSRPFWRTDKPFERSDAWDRWRGESAEGGDDFEPKATPPVTAQAGSAFFAAELGVNEPAEYGAGESKSSAPIIPPNVTPSLPDLLPPRVGAQPLPVAAATARQGAREEAMMATDDLDALANKIKHILDEQARRHGIDV